ncbi:sulfite exporter TauE/SafE family protein [Candidatus Dependentiae bacterium]
MISILYVSILTFITSFIATMAGFGTSTIMIPILSLFLPFPTVMLFVAIIHFTIDALKFIFFRKNINWFLVFYFGISGMIASFFGGLLFTKSPDILAHILGAFLILYVIFLFIKPGFKVKANKLFALFGGGISGFLAGLIGIKGAVLTAFLSAFNLKKMAHIATLSAIVFFIDISRLTSYVIGNITLPSYLMYGMVLFVIAAFAGVNLGYYFIDKIPQQKFRMVVGAFLFIAGIKFLFFGAKI